MKNKITIFLVSALLTALVVPSINIFYSLSESSWREYNIKRLYSLDSLEGEINHYLFNQELSLDNNVALVGKEGFIFLGNNYDRVTELHQGYIVKDNEISTLIDELSVKQAYLNEIGIANIFIIAPDKYSVYPNYLPDWLKISDDKPVDKFMRTASKRMLDVVYLKDVLREGSEHLTFYKTDTHWNRYGAYIGYQETIGTLNKLFDVELQHITEMEFLETEKAGGDLAQFLKIGNLVQDIEPNPLDIVSELKRCKYDTSTQTKYECGLVTNGETHVNQQAFYTENPLALNNKKLLYLRDSFGDANSIYFQNTFNKTIQVHYNNLVGNELLGLIHSEKPDVLIYQVVERGFYSGGYTIPWNTDFHVSTVNPSYDLVDENLTKSTLSSFIDLFSLFDGSLQVESSKGDGFFIFEPSFLEHEGFKLHVALESSTSGQLQIFYQTNDFRQFKESNSIRLELKEGYNTFEIVFSPNVHREQIRFDLPESGGKFIFRNLHLENI
ncbi:alginate O-acetyltransferase AlgX-related protein [Vibrio sp. McD22-P3]|uniref:alginate O-acetyltransferase AlgX-related protein n=1 Tax=Vibrio sp. McD22-P3 TaxID=2724880 RepID=UPI001F1610A5|nr:hypothetical protein [Vibrio sp. McD22-P3]MCF4175265.1 hypothetical protein [Vibrio sp. McD22-P3]